MDVNPQLLWYWVCLGGVAVGVVIAFVELRYKVNSAERTLAAMVSDRRECQQRQAASLEAVNNVMHATALRDSEKLGDIRASLASLTQEVRALRRFVESAVGPRTEKLE